MKQIKFKEILERDMDMLFLEELVSSKAFLNIFLSRIELSDAKVISVEHSKSDNELGESDLTVIIECELKRIALLIEDKIDAKAQPEQAYRYIERGNKGILAGEYEIFFVFIVAPGEYLNANEEAKKYPYSVSYEEILRYFENKGDDRSVFKAAQIRQAIQKKESGYQPIVHLGVSAFWEKYIAYQKANYPKLLLVSSAGKKGSAATWPRFRTSIQRLYMIHKSEFGCVDLTFESAKEKLSEIDELIKTTFGGYERIGATIAVAGKSVVLRLQVPILNFKEAFDEQENEADECFKAICLMTELANKLDTVRIMNILKGD